MKPILISQDKDFLPKSYHEKFFLLKEMGFEGFEIDGKQLMEHFDEVQTAVKHIDFPIITACGGYNGWIGDFVEERRAQGLQDICAILQALSSLGAKGIVVPAAWGMFSLRLPPMTPPRDQIDDEKVLLDSLHVLNQCAVKTNTSVFLEPLNRYEDHMINTLERAAAYIEKGRFSHIKIIADFYHMNIEEAVIEESLFKFSKHVQHIHLADSHRYQPGTGHIDFDKGLQALKSIGYTGAMAFECRVIGSDAIGSYKDSAVFIKDKISKIWGN